MQHIIQKDLIIYKYDYKTHPNLGFWSTPFTVPWGFNCTAVVSNDNWQCGSDFAIPDLASQLVVVVPNNSAINDYGVKICIQNRLSVSDLAFVY